jgi:predicted ATPase/DNA-binding SARP family transcriptional activator
MERLHIKLLGGFSVSLDDQPVTGFRSAKTRALLAYVAAQPDQEYPRAKLATIFWGDLPDSAASTNLRNELSNLKKILNSHPALEISRNTLRLHSRHAVVDVHALRTGLTKFGASPVEAQAGRADELAATIEHYTGEFLAGFNLNDAIEFDDWQLIIREQIHEQVMAALFTLQHCYTEQVRWPELARTARRQLALVPWLESAHRNLMQALAAQDQPQAALDQYARCCAILQAELGVEPSLTTQELATRLRTGRTATSPLRHNLAQQLKSFIGRKQETAGLHDLVQRERLVTLLGIGGAGKSHLAQAVAQNALPDFADGVWFVPLANIEATNSAPDRVALAIGAAMGFQCTDMQTPLTELVTHLADKQALLVLDNWEHILPVAETVIHPLLHNTPVHILATSRVRLMIEGEVAIPLEGLPPTEATALFLDRARRIVPSFPMQGNVAGIEQKIEQEIAEICTQVAGLPLGIELAASWVEHFSVAEIGRSLAEIQIAPQQANRVIDRHHSLGAVFEYSWRLLSPAQQRILARLSIFRGGFDRSATAAVADAGLSELSALIGHSLVQRVAAGRYNLHPLIQEFAAQKLPPREKSALCRRHSRHYLKNLAEAHRSQPTETLQIDFENIRNAWLQAVQAGDAPIIQQSLAHFGAFMAQFGLMADGEALFQRAVAGFGDERGREEGDAEKNEMVANLLEQQIAFTQSIHGYEVLIPLQQRLLSLTSNPALQTKAHMNLANHYAEAGQWEEADAHFDQAESLAQAAPDPRLYISTVEGRIHANNLHFRGDFAQSLAKLQQMLALLDSLPPAAAASGEKSSGETVDLRSRLLQSLGVACLRYGDYALAVHYFQQNLDLITDSAHQQRRAGALLNLALAEDFAGLYAKALAHNQDALALAEEIGAIYYIGLLKTNFCLTLRHSGRVEESLAYGVESIEILQRLKMARLEGQSRNRVGYTLLDLGRWADAYRAYGEALAVWETLPYPYRYESMAGRGIAALHLGQKAEALALVEEALAFVEKQGMHGIVEPVLLLLNSEAVLSAVGLAERAQATLALAETWVQRIAARISDDGVRDVFLHQRSDIQRLRARLG